MYNHYTKYQGPAHGRWITIHGSSSLGGGRRTWQIAITANFLGRFIYHGGGSFIPGSPTSILQNNSNDELGILVCGTRRCREIFNPEIISGTV
jgi:hypothetical protein